LTGVAANRIDAGGRSKDESPHAALPRAVEKTGGRQSVDRKDVLGRGRKIAILVRLGEMDDGVDRGECLDSCVACEVAGKGRRAGSWPRSMSSDVKRQPINPVAPISKIRIGFLSIRDPEYRYQTGIFLRNRSGCRLLVKPL
jgi:hypothetical protein